MLKVAELMLLTEEAAKIQAIAEQTEGALDVQWARTGLVEKGRSFKRSFAPAE